MKSKESQHSSVAPRDINVLPVLTYGSSTNYPEYREALMYQATTKYPNIGGVIEHCVYPKFFTNDQLLEKAGDLSDDPYGIKKASLMAQIGDNVKRQGKANEEKISLFGLINSTLSKESKQRLQQEESWTKVNVDQDPLQLWKLIKSTHIGSNTGKSVADMELARQRYYEVKQGTMSLIDFKRRFDLLVETLTAVGLTKPAEDELAVHFISRLEPSKYAVLKQLLENNLLLGIGTYPKTLSEAYEITYKFVGYHPAILISCCLSCCHGHVS